MTAKLITRILSLYYPRSKELLAFLLFLIALIIRMLIIHFAHFDGLYGQDAFAYLDYTKQVFTFHLTGPFYWPLGYPVIAAFFVFLFKNFVIGAQAACVVLGAALAPLVYGITYEILAKHNKNGLSDRLIISFSFIAGFIMSVSGQTLQSSIVIMSDIPALFCATLSAYALIRLNHPEHWPWLPISTVSLALAIISRWIYGVLILPFGLYFYFEHRSLLPSLRFAVSISIFFAIVISQFLFSQSSAAPVLSHEWLVKWNPMNAVQFVFDNPDGHFNYRWPPLIFYAEPFFHPFYLFPLLTFFVVFGVKQILNSYYLLLFGGWILMLYIYLIGIPFENFRFGLAFFPPIVILAVLGMAGSPPLFFRMTTPLVLISFVASVPFIIAGLNFLFILKADELSATHFLVNLIPSKSTVVTFNLTLTLNHYSDFKVVELADLSESSLYDLICSSDNPTYLFVQVDNIETQWAGKTLQVNFNWARDLIGLRQIGIQNSWTLFEVNRNCTGSP